MDPTPVKLQLNWPRDANWLELQNNANQDLKLVTDLGPQQAKSKILGDAQKSAFQKTKSSV